jgi:hypothetical protein
MDMPNRVRHGSVFLPLVLIGLGIVFLLSNLGVVDWEAFGNLVRLWPLLLVALGLDLLLGRGVLGGLVTFLIVAVVLAGIAVSVFYFGGPWQGPLVEEPISQSLEGASRAEVELAFGAGRLEVGASSDPTALVEGRIAIVKNEDLRRSFSSSGGTARFTLKTQSHFTGRARDRVWTLRLNPTVPLSLKIATGVGEADLDLGGLRLTDFELQGGVGNAHILLPAHGRSSGRISGGVGKVRVTVPAGLGVRIEVRGGLGAVDTPSDYAREDHVYTSPDYETNESRVDLEIRGGIGNVTIERKI